MENPKKIDQIQLYKWDYLWMVMGFHWHSISLPGIEMSN